MRTTEQDKKNIQKLLRGRKTIEKYRADISVKKRKAKADVDRLIQRMHADAFTIDEFLDFNLGMNMAEAARCFRYRRNDDPEKPALCDGCVGRSVVMCVHSVCSDGPGWIDGFDRYYTGSDFMTEQQDVVAIHESPLHESPLHESPLQIVKPVVYFLFFDFENTIPGFCNGHLHEIAAPEFDLMWGMDQFRKLGAIIVQNMITANTIT